MPAIVDELGEEGALEEVDVVTTGTFGRCAPPGRSSTSGTPTPIRMERVWLNDVEAYAGLAAVDAYLGATQEADSPNRVYGGAHVLEDLIAGNTVEPGDLPRDRLLPRRSITTDLLLEDMNQAVMLNPRNSYQCYDAAANSTDRTSIRIWGASPRCGNVSPQGPEPLAARKRSRLPGHRGRCPDLPSPVVRGWSSVKGRRTRPAAGSGRSW